MRKSKGPCVYESPPADSLAVPGFSRYVVTPRGEVFSRFGAWKRRRLGLNSVGYPICGMTDDAGLRHWLLVHRMVAQLFVPGESSGLTVNHRNLVKTDNRAENLEWVTFSANHLHWRAAKRESLSSSVAGSQLADATPTTLTNATTL